MSARLSTEQAIKALEDAGYRVDREGGTICVRNKPHSIPDFIHADQDDTWSAKSIKTLINRKA